MVDDHNPLDDDQGGYIQDSDKHDFGPRKAEDTNPIAGNPDDDDTDGGAGPLERVVLGDGIPLDDWESGCSPCEYDASSGMTRFEWECFTYLTEAERRHLSDGAKRTTIINRKGYWGGGGHIRNPRYVHPEMNDYHD